MVLRLAPRLHLQTALYFMCGIIAHLLASVLKLILPSNRPPRPGDTSISQKWLTHILRQRNVAGIAVSVSSVDVKDLAGNRGLVHILTFSDHEIINS